MSNFRLVFVTCPDRESAEQLATTLVSERLAGCVSIINNVESIYHWEDKIEKGSELLLLIKTSSQLFTKLESRILELHRYSVPEIIALDPCVVNSAYGAWLLRSLERQQSH